MGEYLKLIMGSVTPVMIFLYLIYRKDQNKEPWRLLLKCFIGGFIVAALAISIELPLGMIGNQMDDGIFHAAYMAFIVAAFTEECLKWMIVRWFVWRSPHYNEHYDGIIYAVFVSLGFALVENLLYVFDGGLQVALLRAVLAVPGHGLFAVMMGYHLSLARFGKPEEKNRRLFLGLFFPVMFHGLYDFALMYMNESEENNPWVILGLMVLFTFVIIRIWIVSIKNIKSHLKTDLELNQVIASDELNLNEP